MNYEKVPKKVKVMIVNGILCKTILMNIHRPNDRARLMSTRLGVGIGGANISVGEETVDRLSKDAKEIWRDMVPGGRILFDNDAPDILIAMMMSLVDRNDFMDFYLCQPFPLNIHDPLFNKYCTYAANLSQAYANRYGVQRASCVFKPAKIKKVKKKRESKADIRARQNAKRLKRQQTYNDMVKMKEQVRYANMSILAKKIAINKDSIVMTEELVKLASTDNEIEFDMLLSSNPEVSSNIITNGNLLISLIPIGNLKYIKKAYSEDTVLDNVHIELEESDDSVEIEEFLRNIMGKHN